MKRGFTLVELLGVIVVLGILATIITPVVTGMISEAEEKAYRKQVANLEKIAASYAIDVDPIPDFISLQSLLNSGKIDQDEIINPLTDEPMSGCIKVTFAQEYKQYEFKYIEDSSLCEDAE